MHGQSQPSQSVSGILTGLSFVVFDHPLANHIFASSWSSNVNGIPIRRHRQRHVVQSFSNKSLDFQLVPQYLQLSSIMFLIPSAHRDERNDDDDCTRPHLETSGSPSMQRHWYRFVLKFTMSEVPMNEQ